MTCRGGLLDAREQWDEADYGAADSRDARHEGDPPPRLTPSWPLTAAPADSSAHEERDP